MRLYLTFKYIKQLCLKNQYWYKCNNILFQIHEITINILYKKIFKHEKCLKQITLCTNHVVTTVLLLFHCSFNGLNFIFKSIKTKCCSNLLEIIIKRRRCTNTIITMVLFLFF